MCRSLGKFPRDNIHLKNGRVSTNDRYSLSAGRLNSLGSAGSPFPWKYDVLVLDLAGFSVHANQPDPVTSRTENVELIRGRIRDEAAGTAVMKTHAPGQ